MNTILFAEDDENDALLLRRAFQKVRSPISLQRVCDGEEAIAYLKGEKPFDNRRLHPFPTLLLMDLKMPRKSGLEVLSWVRRNYATRGLRVLILSSSQQIQDINEAYDLGANSYLVKPANFNHLVAMIEAIHKFWFEWSEKPGIMTGNTTLPKQITAPILREYS